MPEQAFDVVTGAFSFTGRWIARRLLALGRSVVTLTGHPDRPNPFGGRVRAAPLAFGNPQALTESLRGADTLYNTYWIRYARGRLTFDVAVENSRTLIRSAREARVRRIVHLSVANPQKAPELPYYAAKASVEQAVRDCGLLYAIVRPTLIYGPDGILLNNIAWMLRRLPVFGIPGRGAYPVQPVLVDDVAQIAVSAGQEHGNIVADAAGPETFTFDELVRLLRRSVGSRALLVHLPPSAALLAASAIGRLLGDVVLTRHEVAGLMAGLLAVDSSPTGTTALSDWLGAYAAELGVAYHNDSRRHFGPSAQSLRG